MKYVNSRQLKRGQAMVEFALTLGPFLLLFFGIIQFGRVLLAYNFVSHAAREASRWASVRGGDNTTPSGPAASSDITSFVKAEADGIDTSALAVTTNGCKPDGHACAAWGPANNKPPNVVSVTVTYNFALSIPFMTATTLPLSSTSEMVIAQ